MTMSSQDVRKVLSAINVSSEEDDPYLLGVLRHDLAEETLAHIASMMKYRYGVESEVMIDHSKDQYGLLLRDVAHGYELKVTWGVADVVALDIREAHSRVWMALVHSLPVSGRDSKAIELAGTDFVWAGKKGLEEWLLQGTERSKRVETSAQALMHGLGLEVLGHIGTVLEDRYGVEVKFGLGVNPLRYSIILSHDCFGGVKEVSYSLVGLLTCDVEKEAYVLRAAFLHDH